MMHVTVKTASVFCWRKSHAEGIGSKRADSLLPALGFCLARQLRQVPVMVIAQLPLYNKSLKHISKKVTGGT